MSFEIQTCQITVPLFDHAKVVVKSGDAVEKYAILAKSEESFFELDLAKIFKTKPANAVRYLLVSPGASIKEGQIIAQKKKIVGKFIFKSPKSGTLVEVTPDGLLKIEVTGKKELMSPVKSQVLEVKEGEDVVLEFPALNLIGDEGVGVGDWGVLEILGKQDEVGMDDLMDEPKNKIIVIKGKVLSGFVYKAEALGAIGIMCGNFDEMIKTEDLALISIGEKEGIIPVDIWNRLQKYKGKSAWILGREKTLRIPLD
ncbi:MAG: hypothetical protein Q8Q24_02575 [bacterium]|nr:hypothetical protein [bacterium]